MLQQNISFKTELFSSHNLLRQACITWSPLLGTGALLALPRPPGVRVVGLVAVPRPKDFEPVVFVGFESAHFSLPADAVVFVFLLVAGLP